MCSEKRNEAATDYTGFPRIKRPEPHAVGLIASCRSREVRGWLLASRFSCGSACGPVIVPVFKTGGRQAILSPVGSTPTRFRHLFVEYGSALPIDLEPVRDRQQASQLPPASRCIARAVWTGAFHWTGGSACGITIFAWQPFWSVRFRSSIDPPCASAICRESTRPIPLPAGLVV